MRRLDEVRERRASRLRTRAARGDGSVQMSTLVDDDVAWLLNLIDRQHDQFLELNKVIADQQERIEDAAHFEAEYDDAVAVLSRVEALAKATQDDMDKINARVAAQTGRASTMRAHVFVDDLLDTLNGSDLPDTLIPGKGSGIRESSTPT